MKKQNVFVLLSGASIAIAVFFGLQTFSRAEGQIISVCVKDNGGMRMIGTEFGSEECRDNERLLTWNIQGIQGHQGDQGLAGESGVSIPCLRVEGNEIYFEGCNVHITNGTDSTASKNGLGNLIVGYNEDVLSIPNDRSGSHNLIIGPEHAYSSYGGLITGRQNIISGAYSSVMGGQENKAYGESSAICGGWQNDANGLLSSITGGRGSNATGVYSSITGGQGHRAIGNSSSISGGLNNTTIADFSSVSGGNMNTASGGSSSVSGGEGNTANGGAASVNGGLNRVANSVYDWVAGGLFQDE